MHHAGELFELLDGWVMAGVGPATCRLLDAWSRRGPVPIAVEAEAQLRAG
jgi:hypothetical protein